MRQAIAFGAEAAVAMAAIVATVAVVRAVLAPRAAAGALGSGLSLTLEFLLASGLLRLATRPNLTTLGMAAFIILLRRVISAGLRYAQTAAS